MSLSPVKQEILETMLVNEKQERAAEIAKDIQKEFPQTMMHLLGLARMGYVDTPKKGLYIISEKGKQAIGVPKISKEQATAILAYAPHDKAFEFYSDIGKPLHLHAHSIRDFANKLERANIGSIEFHTKRSDFEAWFIGLGDMELAKKVALIKKRNLEGEELRKRICSIVEQRYIQLMKFTGQPLPIE